MESRQPPGPRTLASGVGSDAEDRALTWLERRGLELVTRNYRCRYGELDLVMLERRAPTPTLVVVEVRCRRGRALTQAALTVDKGKQQRLMRATLSFVASRVRYSNCPVRFDVVGFDGDPAGRFSVAWIRDAFRP